MKYENQDTTVSEHTIGDFVRYDSQISTNKISKLFTLLSNPYKDNIGSIVREITSNCFDAHKEVNNEEAVIVRIAEDDGGRYISFIDKGPGLTPHRMEKVYSQYLESTKEDSDDFIGCFGIGSKSPLSYTEAFHLLTNVDGTHYHYLVHRGETLPAIDLINTTDTNDVNGTEVKIYFLRPRDEREFFNAIDFQLMYFDNVFLDIDGKDNEYKLFEANTFLYRSEQQITDSVHIALGKVYYPIDYQMLGIPRINMPFALRFNIGELKVTPSREDIRYTEDEIKVNGTETIIIKGTKSIIKDRIEEFRKELAEMHNLQNFAVTDIQFFQTARKAVPKIMFEGIAVKLDTALFGPDDLSKYYFAPFKDLPIKVPTNWFFRYHYSNKIKNGKCYKTKLEIEKSYASAEYTYVGGDTIPKKNKFISDEISEEIHVIRQKKNVEFITYQQYLGLKEEDKERWPELINIYDEEIHRQILSHANFVYDELEITDEWLEAQKAKRADRVVTKLEDGELRYNAIYYGGELESTTISTLSRLLANKKQIVILTPEEHNDNKQRLEIFIRLKYYVIVVKNRMYQKIMNAKHPNIWSYDMLVKRSVSVREKVAAAKQLSALRDTSAMDRIQYVSYFFPENHAKRLTTARNSLQHFIDTYDIYLRNHHYLPEVDIKKHPQYKNIQIISDFSSIFTLVTALNSYQLSSKDIQSDLKSYVNSKLKSILQNDPSKISW